MRVIILFFKSGFTHSIEGLRGKLYSSFDYKAHFHQITFETPHHRSFSINLISSAFIRSLFPYKSKYE